jgi:hypothetical protein
VSRFADVALSLGFIAASICIVAIRLAFAGKRAIR